MASGGLRECAWSVDSSRFFGLFAPRRAGTNRRVLRGIRGAQSSTVSSLQGAEPPALLVTESVE